MWYIEDYPLLLTYGPELLTYTELFSNFTQFCFFGINLFKGKIIISSDTLFAINWSHFAISHASMSHAHC